MHIKNSVKNFKITDNISNYFEEEEPPRVNNKTKVKKNIKNNNNQSNIFNQEK